MLVRPRSGPVALVVAVATAAALIIAGPAHGKPSDDKRRVDAQLAQASAALETATARARTAGAAFASANQQLPGAQRAVERSRGEVAAAQVIAAEAAREATRARAALAVAQARFDEQERKVAAARDSLDDFVRASYEGGPALATSTMLGARSPDQLIAGLNYLGSLAGSQSRAVDAMVASRTSAAEERATVADTKRLADEADARARTTLDKARTSAEAAAAAQSRLVQLAAQRKNALAVAQQEKSASYAQYAALREESRRIAAALRAAATRARGAKGHGAPHTRHPVGNGNLAKPVDGWKSSDFGLRYDPYYNVWQLHAGTDFAAPSGAPIWAAADGVVVRAGWNGGYGRYTCIYHYDLPDGRGLSTCYAHQSLIVVGVGERVHRGELIGRVGTTGASTGNHLHFEVRLDGEPVNPLGWL